MALAEDGDVKVLVVGVDEDWEPVRRFLDGPVPPYMALADGGEVEARFGVQELPESFFVDRTGTMKLQFRGARDWNSEATQRLLR